MERQSDEQDRREKNKYLEYLKRRAMVFDNNFIFSPLDIK